jgi:hypothetical protein
VRAVVRGGPTSHSRRVRFLELSQLLLELGPRFSLAFEENKATMRHALA